MSSGPPKNVKNGSSRVSPRGPVFLSYRHSDGAELALALAWALRASGVPVWLDRSDLPPGDTERRLEEAMQSGLSGAVLLVTPDIAASSVVREIELPHLLRLEAEGGFTLSIASTVEGEAGGLDYFAPDRLLSRTVPDLRRLRQDPALNARDIANIARSHCRQRMEALRVGIESAGQVIDLNLQTRIVPAAIGPYGDLVLRFRPPVPGDRRPHRQGLEDLRLFLSDLPHLLEIAGARHARVSGGAHLSVAFALGAALPTTLIGEVAAFDTAGHAWSISDNAPAPGTSTRLLEIMDHSPRGASRGDAVVYVDLLPTRSDPAFDRLVEAHPGRFASVFHIRPVAEGNLLPEDAGALVLVPDMPFDKDKEQVSLMYDPMRRIYEDMPALKYKVELNETSRTHLKQIASRGEVSARKVKRALVLLKADEGLPDRDIASGLLISASTVGRVRTRFVKEGLDSALNERPRPGQKRKLDGRQEAHLIAVACSDAPEGHADWTLQLLADKVVAMGFAESISLETVRQVLKKTSSSRGRRRSGVSQR